MRSTMDTEGQCIQCHDIFALRYKIQHNIALRSPHLVVTPVHRSLHLIQFYVEYVVLYIETGELLVYPETR
jgi:hypothetical protein